MRLRSVGLALLTAAAATGCGKVPASVQDLRQDAGALCRQANHSFRGLKPPSTQIQDSGFLSSGADHLESQLRALRHVSAPQGVASVYQAALSALAQELTVLHAAVSAIRQGEDPGVVYRTLVRQIAPLETQANNAWQALQIGDCLQ